MNVTVADCLKLPTMREAKLIAGAGGLDRAVSSVSVLELPDTQLLSEVLIVGNELIISALVAIKDSVDKQCRLLRHLHSRGASCLVLFYVEVFVPRVDEALIAVADEIGLPLVVMPYGRMDFRYSDVITDVVEHIHTKRIQGSYYTADLMNTISLLESHQRTIGAVLRLLSDRLRCTLLLTNRYLERKGAAAWPNSNQWDYQQILQTLSLHRIPFTEQTSLEIDSRHVELRSMPVPANTHRGMILFALDDSSHPEETALRQAAEVVALFLDIWDKGTNYEGTDALVEAVLEDNPARMRALSAQMGISIGDVHSMWVLTVTDPQTGKDLSPERKLDVILKLKLNLQEYHRIVIVDSYEPHIIVLTDGLLLDGSIREIGEELAAGLSNERCGVRMFIFEDLENTAQARDAYSRVIRCYPSLCAAYPRRQVFTDNDVRFVQACMEWIDQGEHRVDNCLLPIFRLKAAVDGDLLTDTLCVYLLDAESNSQRTGDILFLHRNTVNYRLNKIRSILKCDLAQRPAALTVYQAAAIYRILGGFVQ